MVPSEDEKVFGVLDLVGEQETDGLEGLLAAVVLFMLTFVLCLLLGWLIGPVACRSSVRSALVRPGQGYHRLVRE